MADEEPKPLAYVPEIILKKRKSNEEWAIRRKEQLEQRKLRSKENRTLIFKRPEQYVKEYRSKEVDLLQMKHRQKRRRSLRVVPESSLLFIIRINSANAIHPKSKMILNKLRLRRDFSGVFMKASEWLMDMLQRVEPYVTYGYPSPKSVRELVFKKGRGIIDKQVVPLTDNNIIERALGSHGVICIEDIVHEITTGGPHFEDVTSFLLPFKLNKPEGGLQGKRMPYTEGGDSGNREDDINELIKRMN